MYKKECTLYELGRNTHMMYLKVKRMLDPSGLMLDGKLIDIPLESFGEEFVWKKPKLGNF